jgi:tetratricopeptide (TPR) repeat protein
MKNRRRYPEVRKPSSIVNGLSKVRSFAKTMIGQCHCAALATIAALMSLLIPVTVAQSASSQHSNEVAIQGTVHGSDGKPVGEAIVRIEQKGAPRSVETKTNKEGYFVFFDIRSDTYVITAEKSGFRSRATTVDGSMQRDPQKFDLIIEEAKLLSSDSNSSTSSSVESMKFADKPNFAIAGVTDWTAVGGHGSDSSLRTSEALANETLALKSDRIKTGAADVGDDATEVNESEAKLREALANSPGSFEANRQLGEFYLHAGRYPESVSLLQTAYKIDPANRDNEYDLALAYEGGGDFSHAHELVRELLTRQEDADLHRLAGELDEKLGDPLAAVHEYERAVRMDPSEQNYFEWGSELLRHRATWQAQEVFRKAVEIFPKSTRMLMGLGTALFAGARYDEAALRLCAASDLNPTDPEAYVFMGKIQMAAPNPMACVEQKLARFVQEQPGNSLANYLYAMAILKRQQQSADKQALRLVAGLLTRAVAIDPKCSEAYLQLGMLSASERNFEKAIDFYRKAIEANPKLSEAHYRLGVAYDRTGQSSKAKQEFELHDEIRKQEAKAIERERREIKQFLVVLPGQSGHSTIE